MGRSIATIRSVAVNAITSLAIAWACVASGADSTRTADQIRPPATAPAKELLKPTGSDQPRRGVGGRGKDPRMAIFHTNVPEHPLDVILSRPESDAITISVLVYSDTDIQIVYGTKPGAYNQKTRAVHLIKGEPRHQLIAKLQPDTHYFYRILFGDTAGTLVPQQAGEFNTAKKKGVPFAFTVQADSHLDGGTVPELYARTLANVLADKPDFHLELGDTFMNDKYPGGYRDALNQYIAQRYYFGLACHSVPFFFVLGNHDGEAGWRQGRDGEGMAAWSNATRKKYFANPFPDGFYTGNKTPADPGARLEDYFAWTWGDALFVGLDPFAYTTTEAKSDIDGWNWTLGKEQYDWLANTLEPSDARYKFVFIHHLVGGRGKDARGGVEAARLFEWGGNSVNGKREFAENRLGWRAPIHELLVKRHVAAVLHGHDHLYVRQELDGITYLEVPQPSHPANRFTESAAEYGYVQGTLLGSAGHIRVTVSSDQTVIEYVRSLARAEETKDHPNREVVDSFAIRGTQLQTP